MPVILDFDSTIVEVSEYLKGGGGAGDEWPWKVMVDTDKCFDKWITERKIGWIIFTFDKP